MSHHPPWLLERVFKSLYSNNLSRTACHNLPIRLKQTNRDVLLGLLGRDRTTENAHRTTETEDSVAVAAAVVVVREADKIVVKVNKFGLENTLSANETRILAEKTS